jgi:hypothetical protein
MPTHQRRARNKPEALLLRNHGRVAVGLDRSIAEEIHEMSTPTRPNRAASPARGPASPIHREVRNRIKRQS